MWTFALGVSVAAAPSGGTTWTVYPSDSLQDAVDGAAPGDVIQLVAGVYDDFPATVPISLEFRGAGAGVTVIDLSAGGGTTVAGPIAVAFTALTLEGGDQVRPITVTDASLTLTDVVVEDGLHATEGGCIGADGAAVVATATTFRSCTAPSGGAIRMIDGTLHCTGCRFEGNRATAGDGGALVLQGAAELTVEGGAFEENEASAGAGGAIGATPRTSITVRPDPASGAGTTFSGGTADHGGAVGCVSSGGGGPGCLLDVSGATFDLNTASASGGHLYVDPGRVTLAGSTLTGGVSQTDTGGGVNVEAGSLTVTDSTLVGNDASDSYGGAIYSRVETHLTRVRLCDNTARIAGAGVYIHDGTLVATNLTLLGNVVVDNFGGAMRLKGTSEIAWSTFGANQAVVSGSGISAEEADVTVTHSVFFDHAAPAVLEATVPEEDRLGPLEWAMVARWSAWWNNDVDLELPFTRESVVGLATHPFPALPTGCTEPIPVFEGELVDEGDPMAADRDGSPADVGATGGPEADEALWADEGDGVPAMWDCAPDDPAVYPGNPDRTKDCVGNDTPTEPPGAGTGPGDTGAGPGGGPPGPPGPGGGEPPSPTDRDPPAEAPVAGTGVSGCACTSGRPALPPWAVLGGLLLVAHRRRARRA